MKTQGSALDLRDIHDIYPPRIWIKLFTHKSGVPELLNTTVDVLDGDKQIWRFPLNALPPVSVTEIQGDNGAVEGDYNTIVCYNSLILCCSKRIIQLRLLSPPCFLVDSLNSLASKITVVLASLFFSSYEIIIHVCLSKWSM